MCLIIELCFGESAVVHWFESARRETKRRATAEEEAQELRAKTQTVCQTEHYP